MFWEIDYAGLDCTTDDAFTVKEYAPIEALDELNHNMLPQLQQEDGTYCECRKKKINARALEK